MSKPVVGRVCVEGKWYQIEYEGLLHIICAQCGCYGHHSGDCLITRNEVGLSFANVTQVQIVQEKPTVVEREEGPNQNSQFGKDLEIPSNPHGEWLVVTHKPRAHKCGYPKGKGKVANNDPLTNKSSNRFKNLLSEDFKEDKEIEGARFLYEKTDSMLHASSGKSRDFTRSPKWKPLSVRKKKKSS